MKKGISSFLFLLIVMTLWRIPSMAAESVFYLPDELIKVNDKAFAGNSSISTLFIPKSVQIIGSKAFANCNSLTDVYIGNNPTMEIAQDAFMGCTNVLFHVYPDSNAELFALAHGYRREILETGSPAWERAISMVGNAGFNVSYFNSKQWTTKRLIVKRSVDYLPDISTFHPTKIIEKSYAHIFIIQFDTEADTEAACSAMLNDVHTVYAEEDQWHEADTVNGAGTVDAGVWGIDDPMGFDAYAAFVKQHSSGTVKIAIIDSGVKQMSFYNSILTDGRNMLEDIDGQSWSADSANHGSVIASIIKDCVGDNSVRIIPVRVIGSSNQLDDELVAEGIDYAVAKGASIINISMSFPQSSVVRDAINHAVNSGVTVVVAAGNDARNVANVFPANMSNVVTVSGISPVYGSVGEYKLSTWSNFGSINYCAPDNYIKTTAFTGTKQYTSFAAPMIASTYALIKLDTQHTLDNMNATCIMANDPSSFGCGMPQLQNLAKIGASSITLNTTLSEKMKIGESVTLSWTVLPTNATDKTITAVSSNEKVLTVTSDGTGLVLNAVGTGTANITLKVNNSTVSVTSKNITVVKPVTSITLSGAPTKLIVGKSITLNAQVLPTDASTMGITWYSTNSNATVQDGIVIGVSAGTATIYAVANDGYGAQSNKLSFPVVVQPDAQSVNLFMDGADVTGTTIKLNPTNTKKLTFSVSPAEAEQKVTFESLNTNVVTVDASGNIKAINPGQTSILAIASTGSNIKATLTVVVENPEVLPIALSVTAGSTTLDIGGTTQLTATFTPSNVTNTTLSWESSNKTVATVNSSGLVTAQSSGSATITATTHNGKSAAITINVSVPVPTAPTLSSVSLGSTNDYVTVKWTTVANATGYKVLYGTSSSILNASTKRVTGQSSSSTSIDVDAGMTYYFWVKAYNDSGDSNASSRKSVSVPEPCTLELDEYSWYPDASEDEEYFIVTCDSTYTVTTSVTWIDYYISRGRLYITVDENTKTSRRTGYVYVECDEHGEEVKLKVVQDYNSTPTLSVTISSNMTTVPANSMCLDFYAEASGGTGTYKYQWYYATSSTGTGTKTYTSRSINDMSIGGPTTFWYYCVVTSGTQTATSNRIKITVQ